MQRLAANTGGRLDIQPLSSEVSKKNYLTYKVISYYKLFHESSK